MVHQPSGRWTPLKERGNPIRRRDRQGAHGCWRQPGRSGTRPTTDPWRTSSCHDRIRASLPFQRRRNQHSRPIRGISPPFVFHIRKVPIPTCESSINSFHSGLCSPPERTVECSRCHRGHRWPNAEGRFTFYSFGPLWFRHGAAARHHHRRGPVRVPECVGGLFPAVLHIKPVCP